MSSWRRAEGEWLATRNLKICARTRRWLRVFSSTGILMTQNWRTWVTPDCVFSRPPYYFRITKSQCFSPPPPQIANLCQPIFSALFECLISTDATTGYSRRGSQSNYITLLAQSADRKSWKQLHKLANQRTVGQSPPPPSQFRQSDEKHFRQLYNPFTWKNELLLFFNFSFL